MEMADFQRATIAHPQNLCIHWCMALSVWTCEQIWQKLYLWNTESKSLCVVEKWFFSAWHTCSQSTYACLSFLQLFSNLQAWCS